jgi:hypothetical protein
MPRVELLTLPPGALRKTSSAGSPTAYVTGPDRCVPVCPFVEVCGSISSIHHITRAPELDGSAITNDKQATVVILPRALRINRKMQPWKPIKGWDSSLAA